jgi:hypothetical protein
VSYRLREAQWSPTGELVASLQKEKAGPELRPARNPRKGEKPWSYKTKSISIYRTVRLPIGHLD